MRVLPLLAYVALSSIALPAQETKSTLLDLGKTKFAARPLTDAEIKLLTDTQKGEPASEISDKDKEKGPTNAATLPDAPVVHAECLTWLITDRQAAALVTHRGIAIYGTRIDGDLNLDDAET